MFILCLLYLFLPMVGLAQDIGVRTSLQKATFGGGCFWCVEAIFERIEGVTSCVSGYAGGDVKHPNYKDISTGKTGHAEVIQITYNETIVPYALLLEIFWKTHDPTTLNQQGYDKGTQYRSVIFYHNQQQQQTAQALKKDIEQANIYDKPIVTEIKPLGAFYKAEAYHQNYYELNKNQGYCQYVIAPKLKKLDKLFAKYLKKK